MSAGNSYDRAVRDFKWLHEGDEEAALEQVLRTTTEIKNVFQQPHTNGTGGEESWLMKPIANYTDR